MRRAPRLLSLALIGMTVMTAVNVGCQAPAEPDFKWQIYTFEVPAALEDTASGDFYTPSLRYDSIPVDPRYTHALSFQVSPMLPPRLEALPSQGPLVLYSDDLEVLVFSPMDHFFESLVGFEAGSIQAGLQGDLETIPAGLRHRFLQVTGRGIQATLERWGELMRADRGRARADRYADRGLSHLGYWTDNGSYYYYNKEPGQTEEETLLSILAEARARGIPYGYLQLDSWWYFKQPSDSLVPPAWLGLVRWEPQPEMFPAGLAAFQAAAGLPVVAHNRWFAPQNAYRELDEFVEEGDFAMPLGRPVFDRLVRDAAAWGLVTYEQDWLANQFWGLRYLRAGVGRCERWMSDLHAAVADRGLTMQLCMASPAHLLDALDRPAVTNIRTSIDYAASISKESFWPQFHTVAMLAWAVGLLPFKDTFRTTEAHPQAEALISSLSAGLVGPGDALGTADAALLHRTCRADGLLLKPDRPAFPLDAMFLPHERPYTTVTWSERPGLGRWLYLAAFHLASEHPQRTDEDRLWVGLQYGDADAGRMFVYPEAVRDFGVTLAELGVAGPALAYDWRSGRAWRVEDRLELPRFEEHYDFAYLVLVPILDNGLALVGETGKFVTLADRRFAEVELEGDSIRLRLEGAPGEEVVVRAFDATAEAWLPDTVVRIDAASYGEARVGR
jgi:hypothetical protein